MINQNLVSSILNSRTSRYFEKLDVHEESQISEPGSRREPSPDMEPVQDMNDVIRSDVLIRSSKPIVRATSKHRYRITYFSGQQVGQVLGAIYTFQGRNWKYRKSDLRYDMFHRKYMGVRHRQKHRKLLHKQMETEGSPQPLQTKRPPCNINANDTGFSVDSAGRVAWSECKPAKLSRYAGSEASVPVSWSSKGHPRYRAIPAAVKNAVWDRWNGRLGFAPCFCCRRQEIRMSSFHCGHVVARSLGGDNTVENMRPICQNCNSSMGTTNMQEFIDKFGLHDT